MKLNKRSKLICGVGINDADYNVQEYEVINGKRKNLWICPFYTKWCNIINRCYSDNYHKQYPTYRGCTVSEEWKTFSNFKAWMETQDWKDKCLDKDILFKGNKIYSSNTCVFVTNAVNLFFVDRSRYRGKFPLGVSIKGQSYTATCSDPFKRSTGYVGIYPTPEEAHLAWKARKHQYAVELAECTCVMDERVRQVLLTRYL